MDRTVPPEVNVPGKVQFLSPQLEQLGDKNRIHLIEGNGNEVVKIEWVFNAGIRVQNKSLLALATNELLKRGIRGKSAEQIAEEIDFYGAFFEHEVTKDWASLSLYCLTKYQQDLIPLISRIIKEADFPKKELEIYLDNKRQQYHINKQKVSFLARNAFNDLFYGKDHPYNSRLDEDSFNNLSREDIIGFYESHYKNGEMEIFISGDFNKNTLNLVKNEFTEIGNSITKLGIRLSSFNPQFGKHHIDKNDALQTAIRVGALGVDKSNEDYADFKIMNTVLGGYFGSRLMANLREDKGYTYGISSSLIPFQKDGLFISMTEVNSDYTQKAIDEILKEIGILRNQEISTEEVNVVRNYMLGAVLKSVDGVFSQMEAYKQIYLYNLDYSFYESYFDRIRSVNSLDINNIAAKYLGEDKLVILTAGRNDG